MFDDFVIKQLPIPILEPPIGRRCEVEYLFEYNGKQFMDSNNKKVHLYPNEILAILSFLSHRLTKLIAWLYPPVPGGNSGSNGDIEGLYGNINWNSKLSSDFINILRLNEETRNAILRTLVIYEQAISHLTVDITLGTLFLCISIETLASFIYKGQDKKHAERFFDSILNNISENYFAELSKEYNFATTGGEFKRYLEEIYGRYRSGFVHSGRIIASHEYWLMRDAKTLFTKKEYTDDNGCRYSKQYVNLPLFEKIVWHSIKNYLESLLCKNDLNK